MKKFILSVLLALTVIGFSGCAEKRIVLVPQSEYYPTFPTTDFNTSKPYKLEMWAETEDVNGTTENYLVAEKLQMMGFIRDTKDLRGNYNLLLKKLNEFNTKIEDMNQVQNSKKPQEVDTFDYTK